MRGWGPVFAHVYGISEDDVLQSWDVERFERYRRFAEQVLKLRGAGIG